MAEYSDCLRPRLTQKVVERLCLKQESINLIGKDGRARDILLEDIKKMLPAEVVLAKVSLKLWHKNHNKLIKEIAKKLHIRLASQHLNLPRLLEQLPSTQTTVLIFDYFDAIMDRPDQELDKKYDLSFIHTINHIKDMDAIRVICVTKYAHKNHTFRGNTSPLVLLPEDIRPLNYTELEHAWKRFLTADWHTYLLEHHQELRELTELAEKQTDVVKWMEWMAERICYQDLREKKKELLENLKTWHNEYKKKFERNGNRKVLDANQGIRKQLKLWGIEKAINPFIEMVKAISSFLTKKS